LRWGTDPTSATTIPSSTFSERLASTVVSCLVGYLQ
jgi:hypothetical protein